MDLTQRLDSIHVHVAVPGQEIYADLRNRREVTMSFGRDVYGWVNEQDLQRHMGSLARLLLAGWVRQYRAAVRDELGEEYFDSQTELDREYLAARGELVSTGQSADGVISISTTGMQDAQVAIKPGTFSRLGEAEFVARVKEAVLDLAEDHMTKIHELKDRFYA